MKKNRQEAIIELIQQYPIETQEELLSRLNQADLLSDRSGR